MKGLEFKLSTTGKDVLVVLEPLLIDKKIEAQILSSALSQSDYSKYYMLDDAIISACDKLKEALDSDEMDPIEATVAYAKDAEIEITIAADKMSAEISVTAPFMGKIPSVDTVIDILNQHDVKKGISKKRIRTLLQKAADAQPGVAFSDLVALGLPARSGKDSYIKPLVANALERALAPKVTDSEKVDMRDFGDILCVKKGEHVARRMPPTVGRTGFTVTDKKLLPEAGDWLKIKLDENVEIDPEDENRVLATVAGLPKVSNSNISVNNVYSLDGVNVATGNIKFDGAVIVNGDVTEKMRVVAKGDITINGFVESAYIEAGGDIIVMQGASGKMQNADCEFIARGSIFIQHGQGLNITSGKDLNIAKQLAYSNVNCKGDVTVGAIDNPAGKLFASNINCGKTVIAGHVGAVSGSALTIDYSDSYNLLMEKYESLSEQFDTLSSQNADHEIKISGIVNRRPSKELEEKLALLKKELELERVFLNWIRINREEVKALLDDFSVRAKVVATSKLFPGVNIKLNKKSWRAEKECGPCRVVMEEKDWIYMPKVGR